MKKRVLVFGATGLLGSELVRTLNERSLEVLTPGRAEVDLTDARAVEQYVTSAGVPVVINAAALIGVDALEKDPLPGWQVNTLAPAAIARALGSVPNAVFVHISSQYVFDGARPFNREDDALSAINTYGHTKAVAEGLVGHYGKQGGVLTHIVRTSWIYSHKRPTFVDEVAKTLKAGKQFDASTEQHGNPTSASDLAAVIADTFILNNHESGIFHLVNHTPDVGVSRYDIALEIASIVGADKSLVVPTQSSAVFGTRRPSSVLVNTQLPAMRDWKVALGEHLTRNS